MLQQAMELVVPSLDRLEAYADALRRGGFYPDNIRRERSALEELAKIEADPPAFVASLDDREGKGGPITLPDGSQVKRLPGYRRWLWDGDFCGQIGLRWQPGADTLPAHVLGHVGYAVVPWKRGRGYATEALRQMLPVARDVGLHRLEITTDRGNTASVRVIEANGGRFVEEFVQPSFGPDVRWRFCIDLVTGVREGQRA